MWVGEGGERKLWGRKERKTADLDSWPDFLLSPPDPYTHFTTAKHSSGRGRGEGGAGLPGVAAVGGRREDLSPHHRGLFAHWEASPSARGVRRRGRFPATNHRRSSADLQGRPSRQCKHSCIAWRCPEPLLFISLERRLRLAACTESLLNGGSSPGGAERGSCCFCSPCRFLSLHPLSINVICLNGLTKQMAVFVDNHGKQQIRSAAG